MKIVFDNNLRNWTINILMDKRLKGDIIAINIGLFEEESNYCIYAMGSNEYDEEDDDWACNEDYIPNPKYFRVGDIEINSFKWEQFNTFMVDKLKTILNNESCRMPENIQVVTTGFDDGDLEVVWKRT